MTFRWWERWGALTGALAIACWIVAFLIASSNPSTTDSDAKITAFYRSHSHQVHQIITWFVFVAGLVLLLGFLSALRARLAVAEGEPGRLTALAYGAGVASAVLWFIAVSLFSVAAFAANDTGKFQLDPNTYRLVQDFGYMAWVGAVIVAALTVWSTSAIALRSGLLPKWFAWIGVVAGILQLFAIFFIPAFIFWGWILVASVLLFARGAAAHRPGPTAPAG
jgi:hypothetical protein